MSNSSSSDSQYCQPGLLVEGREIYDGSGIADVINPATSARIGLVPQADAATLDATLEAAESGFHVWRRTSPAARAAVMMKAASLIRERLPAIALTMTLEQGKPMKQSELEIALCAETLEWFAAEASRSYGRIVPTNSRTERQLVLPEPIGPVVAFSPWNFPALLAMRKIAPALAAGCSMILKPSEETPGSPFAIAKALNDAGLPPGVLNVVYGNPSEISRHLIASPVIRKITFTGSIPVGRQLAHLAADGPKPCTLELGGHAPVLVLEDCDVDFAAKLSAISKTFNAGQVCTSPTRYFVHASIYDEFLAKFSKNLGRFAPGNGVETGTRMGPLANARRIADLDRLVADALSKGAEIVCGGQGQTGNKGFFWAPTLLTNVDPGSAIMIEEPFGPLATVAAYDDLDEAIAKANDSRSGLAAYAFTASASASVKLADELEVGVLGINSFAVSNTDAPFSGVKDSGYGYEGGIEGLQAFMTMKSINHAHH